MRQNENVKKSGRMNLISDISRHRGDGNYDFDAADNLVDYGIKRKPSSPDSDFQL